MNERFESYVAEIPVIAIIRGVTPEEVVTVGGALIRAGIKLIEVPLNSPRAFESIKRLTDAYGNNCITGAGTVLVADDVSRIKDAGGTMIVSPNTESQVIEKAIAEDMIPIPGFATASEAFEAYKAGARHLKLFPADTYGPGHVKALRAVLPGDAKIYAVGGAAIENAAQWNSAGVNGFGIGSNIYNPGDDPDLIHEKALAWVNIAKKFDEKVK